MTVDFCRAGFGSIKHFDEADLESIIEVLDYLNVGQMAYIDETGI